MQDPGPQAAQPVQGVSRQVGIAAPDVIPQRMLLRAFGFFGAPILVRLLAPEEFGSAALLQGAGPCR